MRPVGSGWFRFGSWRRGASIELAADTANYRGKPKIDRVATLEDTAELHRLQEQNTIEAANVIRGKLVVKL